MHECLQHLLATCDIYHLLVVVSKLKGQKISGYAQQLEVNEADTMHGIFS